MQRQTHPALIPLINFLSDPTYWALPTPNMTLHQPSTLLPGAVGIMLHYLRTTSFQLEKFQHLAKNYASMENATPQNEVKRKLAAFCDIILCATTLADIEQYISSINNSVKLV